MQAKQKTETYDRSVVIPHYNDPERLLRCLKALAPQMTPDTEIILADNNSKTRLDEVRQKYPDVRIVTQTEPGAGPARNLGAEVARGEWLYFIDADCVPSDTWLAVGRRIARKGQVFGGRVAIFHETKPPLSGAEAFETVFAFKMKDYRDRKGFLGSGNLLVHSEDFEMVGGFRSTVAEDRDWSQRATAAGLELVYEDDFAASHPSRQDWPALRRKWERLNSEAFSLHGDSFPQRIKWVARAVIVLLSGPAHVPRVLGESTLGSGEKLKAVVVLLRLRTLRFFWMLRDALTGKVIT